MEEMTSRELTQEIIGWTAVVFSSYYLFIPIIPFLKIIKGKISFEEAPIAQVSLTYLSCLCWYIYSKLLYYSQIRIINLIGLITNGILIIIYLFYEIKKYLYDAVLNALILSSGSYLVYLILDSILESDETIGKICIAVICLLSMFQIKTIFLILGEKNYKTIPIGKAWLSLTTATTWGIYGYMINELYIVFPQVIFGFFSIVIIFIYAHFKNNNKYLFFNKDEDKKEKIKEEKIKKENNQNEENNELKEKKDN